MVEEKIEIALIGGSGLYDVEILEDPKEIKISTPFGETSDAIITGNYKGRKVAFLSRHGRGHKFPAHLVNYRANIWALKKLGVKRILASNACGSLQQHYKPGELVMVDQFIDRIRGRHPSFYEGTEAGHLKEAGMDKVCHISMADPFCSEMRWNLSKVAQKLDLPFHTAGTYLCIEGPRFSTRAESKLFRSWGADIIGMTVIPECTLAREAGICYASVALVTDYDVWAEKPVELKDILKTMKENVHKAKQLISETIEAIPKEQNCKCAEAIKTAIF